MNKAHVRISKHAVDQYRERVDKTISFGQGRVAVFRVWQLAQEATEYQLKYVLIKPRNANTTFMVAETCFGLIVMPIRDGVMTTLWMFER